MEKERIGTIYIKPGSPWENGCIESVHDKLRDDCLDRELFGCAPPKPRAARRGRRSGGTWR